MEMQELLYSDKKLYMKPDYKRQRVIDKLTVDMTGWSEGVNHNKDGIYSYSADFVDDANQPRTVVCTGMKSNGMHKLLTELRQKYNLVSTENTQVYVIAPQDAIMNKQISHGAISKCCTQALRYHGIKALDFYPTDKGDSGVRLESVLDEIVHQTNISAGVTLRRRAVFPRSIYHYDQAEQECREGKLDIEQLY